MKIGKLALILVGLVCFKSFAGNKSTNLVYLKNWGLTNNSPENSSIHAPEAWKIEDGCKDVIVAVLDTGVDVDHPDLTQNIWENPFVRYEYGWNFVNDTPNPRDDHGHGTHVAGIIGSFFDAQNGVSGVAHHVSIMPVKYFSDENTGLVNLRNTVSAIKYAIENGAQIINYSGGGPEFSEDEYLAINYAKGRGVLFVSAAGNEHKNTDNESNYYYPSSYRLENMISVASIDIQSNLLLSSNWGTKSVDVAAPGENIYSTLPGGRYGYMTGTSQATAFVTGLAALLLTKEPTLTPQTIKQIIMASVDPVPSLKNKILTGGKINAYSALKLLQARNKPLAKYQKSCHTR